MHSRTGADNYYHISKRILDIGCWKKMGQEAKPIKARGY